VAADRGTADGWKDGEASEPSEATEEREGSEKEKKGWRRTGAMRAIPEEG